jgi:adenylyltransferase/sulfurtransferase
MRWEINSGKEFFVADRYLRQQVLPEIGNPGQEALFRASVLMVGCGGLASPVLMYLAGAGVGRIGIVDGDRVDVSNLHRQVLFQENQTGLLKTESAKENLLKLNPSIQIDTHSFFLDSSNAETLASDYDLLIDGTDQYEAKTLLNRVSISLKKPVIFAGVTALDAQVFVSWGATDLPCYQCIYPKAPSPLIRNCEEAGVLGPMVGVAGSLQALEAIKLLCQIAPLKGEILTMDGRDLQFLKRKVSKNPDCPACGSKGTDTSAEDMIRISINRILAARNEYVLIDVREESEFLEDPIPNAIKLPLSRIEKQYSAKGLVDLPSLAPGMTPVFFCKSGVRARKAAALLQLSGNVRIRFLPNPITEVRARL